MKKSALIFDSRIFLYSVILFLLNILSVPATGSFDFSQADPLLIIAVLVLLLFSTACAVILHKLIISDSILLRFCAIFLLADPLFRCSILNFSYLIILTVAAVLCLYLIIGKTFIVKTILVQVFIFASTLINKESAFSITPLVALIYGFSVFPGNEILTPKVKKKKTDKKPTSPKSIVIAAVMTALWILSIFVAEKIPGEISVRGRILNSTLSTEKLFEDCRFLIAAGPYLALFICFFAMYISAKTKDKKKSSRSVTPLISLCLPILVAFALITTGIFAFNYVSGITVFNLVSVAAIVIISLKDIEGVSEPANRILFFYQKHKFAFGLIFAGWFGLTQYLFNNVQYTVMDMILSVTGGLL